MTFPTKGGEWTPDAVRVFRWEQLYRQLDVQQELRKAAAWLEANPTRRKTDRGMPKFLVGWFNRATPRAADWSDRAAMRSDYDRWKQAGGCRHQPRCPHFTACQVVSQRKSA